MSSFVFGRNPRLTLVRILVLVIAAVVVVKTILLPVRLQGISMLPAYRSGTLNVANRIAYLWRAPARGDVIAIRMAGPSVVYVKRIVGLPGERLAIVQGVVQVNGRALAEPGVVFKAPWNLPAFTLAGDEYFVVGDNRAMPMEAHDFGRVQRDRILGKLLF